MVLPRFVDGYLFGLAIFSCMAPLTAPGVALASMPSALVFIDAEYVVLPIQQGIDTFSCNVVGLALRFSLGADLGVVHAGAVKEIRIRGAGLQCGDGDAAVAQFVTKTVREREHESLGGGIDGLAGRDHFSGDGGGKQDSAFATIGHALNDIFRELHRAQAIETDHVQLSVEICLNKESADADSGIQAGNREGPAEVLDFGPELVYSFPGGEVCVDVRN